MAKDDELLRLKERNLLLEAENAILRKENEALKKKLDFARGIPGEDLIAELTGGVRTRYKDRHDVTAKNGIRFEVKLSRLHVLRSKSTRWIWDSLLGQNETKVYDFLVLMGEKDSRHEAQYPSDLPYVCFLVPRSDVDQINGTGDCVAMPANMARTRAQNAERLKGYLVHSRQSFKHSVEKKVAAP